jgi:hypothetical protein
MFTRSECIGALQISSFAVNENVMPDAFSEVAQHCGVADVFEGSPLKLTRYAYAGVITGLLMRGLVVGDGPEAHFARYLPVSDTDSQYPYRHHRLRIDTTFRWNAHCQKRQQPELINAWNAAYDDMLPQDPSHQGTFRPIKASSIAKGLELGRETVYFGLRTGLGMSNTEDLQEADSDVGLAIAHDTMPYETSRMRSGAHHVFMGSGSVSHADHDNSAFARRQGRWAIHRPRPVVTTVQDTEPFLPILGCPAHAVILTGNQRDILTNGVYAGLQELRKARLLEAGPARRTWDGCQALEEELASTVAAKRRQWQQRGLSPEALDRAAANYASTRRTAVYI